MSALDAFWAAPPVSRTLTALTLGTSLLVHGGLIGAGRVVFALSRILKFPTPEIWRLVTPFFVTGPGLSIAFDTFFLWNYSKGLEVESSRFAQPGDYLTYIMFLCVFILSTAGVGLRGYVFLQALILGIAYTYGQDNKNKKVSFFIISFQAIWLPWAILGLTLVMGGPEAALQQGTGLLGAHLYDFLTRIWPMFGGGTNYIQTPAFAKRLFGAERQSVTTKGYGTAFRQASQAPSQGSSTGFSLTSSWSHRGQGHRLGGD